MLAHGLGIDLATLWRWQAERESSHVVSIDRANNAEGGSDTGRLPEEPSKLR